MTSGSSGNDSDKVPPVITATVKNETVNTGLYKFTAGATDDKDGSVDVVVKHNDKKVEAKDQYYEITLRPGVNKIEIFAWDKAGNEAKQTYTINYEIQQTYAVTFETTPKEARVIVKDKEGNEVKAEKDKTYRLKSGKYSYTASASGYNTKTEAFAVMDESKTIRVDLIKSNSGGNGGKDNSSSGGSGKEKSTGSNNSAEKKEKVSITGGTLTPLAAIKDNVAIAALSSSDVKEALESLKKGETYTLKIDLTKTPRANGYQVSFDKEAFKDLKGSDLDKINIATPAGDMQIGIDTLRSFSQNTSDDVAININNQISFDGKHSLKHAINVAIIAGGREIKSLQGNKINLELPCNLNSNEDTNAIVGGKIVNGEFHIIKRAKYKDNKLSMQIEELGIYGIKYNPVEFSDTINHWAKDSINYLAARGIIKGTGKNTFNPNKTLSRGEFIHMLVNSIDYVELSDAKAESFEDVSEGQWYTDSIKWAAEHKVIKGYDNGKFGVNDLITREQMAVILVNFAEATGLTLGEIKGKTGFSDEGNISSYAGAAVKSIASSGIMRGKGNNKFAPKDNATRAEAAALLHRIYN